MRRVNHQFIHTGLCPAYNGTDNGTGRMRASTSIFKQYRLKINSVVRIMLNPSGQEVLCTVWPDSHQVLSGTGDQVGRYEACVDCSVVKGSSSCSDEYFQICDSVPSKSVSSYYMHVSRSLYVLPYSTFPFLQDGAEERDATSDSEATGWNLIDLAPRLIGLPIAKGFSVEIINGLKLECHYVSPGGLCLVRPSSILLRAPPESVNQYKQLTAGANAPPSSNFHNSSVSRAVAVTGALQTIIDSVVLPFVHLHIRAGIHSPSTPHPVEFQNKDSALPEIYNTPTKVICTPRTTQTDKQLKLLSSEHDTSATRCLINGLLLTGPPGVGKTYSLKALQLMAFDNCQIRLEEIKLRDILTADDSVGDLSHALHNIFKPRLEGVVCDNFKAELVLILLDEVDSLGRGDGDTPVQHMIKHCICEYMDTLHTKNKGMRCNSELATHYVFIATTNRPGDVDSQLRIGSRLAKEINFINSSLEDKERLLQSILSAQLEILQQSLLVVTTHNIDISGIVSHFTPRLGGYAAADIAVLVDDAVRRFASGLRGIEPELSIFECFEKAYVGIIPSCLRSNVITVPKMTYDDVIGHAHAKQCFQRALSYYQKDVGGLYRSFGVSAPGGILLHGPPGNSKTRLVLASASVHGLPVISLSSADVYSAFVGGAEAEIRRAFSLARQSQPCILFMDELDTLIANRGIGGECGDISVESRVLATLLNEMDGIDGPDSGIVVVGTSNRIDLIDAALLRKGRLNQLVEMKNPDKDDALALLRYFASQYKLTDHIVAELCADVEAHFKVVAFAVRTPLNGAEIRRRCQEAAMDNIRDIILNNQTK